jgi:hypothetical protein
MNRHETAGLRTDSPTEHPSGGTPYLAGGTPYLEGDLFDFLDPEGRGVLVIPTNAARVHGAGLAKLARQRGLFDTELGAERVFVLDVKHRYWERTDVELLKVGLRRLLTLARRRPNLTFFLPLVGLGHGEGDPEVIVPLLKQCVAFAEEHAGGNVRLVLPTPEALGRTPMGSARTDHTLGTLDRIKELLAQPIG